VVVQNSTSKLIDLFVSFMPVKRDLVATRILFLTIKALVLNK